MILWGASAVMAGGRGALDLPKSEESTRGWEARSVRTKKWRYQERSEAQGQILWEAIRQDLGIC